MESPLETIIANPLFWVVLAILAALPLVSRWAKNNEGRVRQKERLSRYQGADPNLRRHREMIEGWPKTCPKCGHVRQEGDSPDVPETVCPNCEVVYQKATTTLRNHAEQAHRVENRGAATIRQPGSALSGAIMLAMVVGLLWLFWPGDDPSDDGSVSAQERERTPEQIADSAILDCKQRLRTWLKAPSTAEFSWQHQTIQHTGNRWVLSGYVDAQNSFGVPLRKRWACHVDVENGSATVVRTKFLE